MSFGAGGGCAVESCEALEAELGSDVHVDFEKSLETRRSRCHHVARG